MNAMKLLGHRYMQLSIAVIGVLLLGTVVLAWHATAPSLKSANKDTTSHPQSLGVNTANALSLGVSAGAVDLQGQTTNSVQASNTLQTQPAPSPQTAGNVQAAQ